MATNDLFETLKEKVGCMYISDISFEFTVKKR